MVVTVTQGGYIKRTPLAEFRAQRRGGKGLSCMATKEDDVVTTLFVANTHTPLLFFTTDGMVYKLKCWRLPLAGATRAARRSSTSCRSHRGLGRRDHAGGPPEEDWDEPADRLRHLGRRRAAQRAVDFTNVMRNGKIAMKLPEGVSLVNARICDEEDDVMLSPRSGARSASPPPMCASSRAAIRPACAASGWRRGDRVVSMAVIRHFEASARGARRLSEDAPRGGRRDRGGRGGRGDEDEDAVEAGQLSNEAMPRCRRPRT
jgi:DNA gyrase subunit A